MGGLESNETFVSLREEAVLFSLIGNFEYTWNLIGDQLTTELFQVERHRDCFESILALFAKGIHIDPVTVLNEMQAHDATLWLDSIIQRVDFVPALQVAHYVAEMNQIHQAQQVSEFIEQEKNVRKPPDDRISALIDLLRQVKPEEIALERAQTGLACVYQDILDREGEQDEKILSTPWRELNAMLSGGMRPGEMCVIAGRPGMGKSALSLCLARHFAETGKSVLYVSLEMSRPQISQRLMAQISGVPLGCIRKNQLTHNQLGAMRSAIEWDYDLVFCDHVRTLEQVRSMIIRARAQNQKIDALIVDYLQLFDGESETENRQLEIAKLSRDFKLLSQQEEMPVVILSQLNRSLESRKNKRPLLSDLRESGALEQDADLVMFLYRPWIYDKTESHEETELILAKHRAGPTGTIPLRWIGETCSFIE